MKGREMLDGPLSFTLLAELIKTVVYSDDKLICEHSNLKRYSPQSRQRSSRSRFSRFEL
jgi:hypothetical protein